MKKIFNSVITTTHPLIKGHIVYGQNILPGLAYIDMLYQLVQDAMGFDYRNYCLKRLSISNPLIVKEDQPVKLKITFDDRPKYWQITVEGTETDLQGRPLQNKLYITAEFHEETVTFTERIDIEAMKQSATRCADIEMVYAEARKQSLVHQGMIKANGNIYLKDSACLIEVNVDKTYHDEAKSYLFHPTLIDGSAMAAGILGDKETESIEGLYLPIYYESFSSIEPLRTDCYAVVKPDSHRSVNDISSMDMAFFNREGEQVAELKGITAKLVRSKGQINPDLKEENLPNVPRNISKIEAVGVNRAPSSSETVLQNILARYINQAAAQIDLHTGFYELGLQSSQLLAVVKDLESLLGVSLNPTLLFEYTTVAELVAYFTEKYPSKFEQLDEIPERSEEEPLQAAQEVVPEVMPTAVMPVIDKEIAVIGMAGRYPMAKDLQEFWLNLQAGKDCISEIPKSRWDWQQFEGVKSPSGKNISRWGGFIDDPDCFDPHFFRISPREVEMIDPQERLFLETCWEAMEDAGYTPKTLVIPKGPDRRRYVGVFVGVMHKDYTLVGAEVMRGGQMISLSLNNGPIANRVSYFCNFHGPSMAVDTLCSSSLSAVHLALESIKRGECEVALAGGVNLSLHPGKYMSYGLFDMHSSDGYCHTFGKGGDGYVSGEGIGAVLLKPLRKAVQDGDHIYAVIKGSAINHGGTVSGVTVPSPIAQADVITACLQKTGIHPRTISYIEAHGTGTSLGDPIEIQGLVKAYRQYTQDSQFCSIGSVKSNIGHTESAAGISGLIKAVLQLYHKTLVPSLHAEELNPYIDFKQSPFHVQQKTETWEQPKLMENGREVIYPRRAGLSSFGATGSNAHVILEEYLPHEKLKPAVPKLKTALIPLSAMTGERLQAYAQKLLKFLKEHPETGLLELAYTLQVGREALDERVIFIVKDIPELIEKLEAFVDSREPINDCWRAQVKQNKDIIEFFSGDQDSLELINKWIAKGNVKKIAELWVKGYTMDWQMFYGAIKPRRISLPTYPFTQEHYWIPETDPNVRGAARGSVTAAIHPLLQQNTSDLLEQRFSSTFTGREFFLNDHAVKGQRVLPGVAYLEMARAAVEQAVRGLREGQASIRLENVVWVRPIAIEAEPAKIHIGLFPAANGEIAYEIYSEPGDANVEPIIHSQGSAKLDPLIKTSTLDIKDLQAKFNPMRLSADIFYEAYKEMGIVYGPGYRALEAIYAGPGQLLAKLALPTAVFGTKDQFVLHPSLMDSALHASLGLMFSTEERISSEVASPEFSLPLALQELEILNKCTSEMWAFIRYSEGSKAGDKVKKTDIDICDAQGNVCVRMKGFTSKVYEGEVQTNEMEKTVSSEVSSGLPVGNIMLLPVWDAVRIEKGQVFPSPNEQVVIVGGNEKNWSAIRQYYSKAQVLELRSEDSMDVIIKELEAYGSIDHVIWIAPQNALESLESDLIIEEQDKGVIQLFRTIKALLNLGYGDKNVGWTVITMQAQPIHQNDEVNPTHASIHGLIGSMAKEYPNWKLRIIDFDSDSDKPFDDMFKLPSDRQGRAWVYRNKEWYRQQLLPLNSPPLKQSLYKTGGVYVVIGGAGGVGKIWSEYMIRTYQARIIWIGRRQINAAIQAKIDKLAALGCTPTYITADATDRKSLEEAYEEIKKQYSQINGVVLSAMVLSEQSLANMEEEGFKAGLSAKVAVDVRVAQVFQKEPLDFVLFFSSIMSFTKAANQSDYAAGCTFNDAFAHQLGHRWPCSVKVINWGFWNTGGGNIDASGSHQQETFLSFLRFAQIGIGLVESPEAMAALEILLAGSVNQIGLMKTTKPLLIEGMNPAEQIIIDENGSVVREKRQLKSNIPVKKVEKPSLSQPVTAVPAREFEQTKRSGIIEERHTISTAVISNFSGKGRRPEMKGLSLEECVEWDLKEHISNLLKIRRDQLDREDSFTEFGFNSVSLTRFATLLSNHYGFQIAPNLFFGYFSIEKLTRYFLTKQQEAIQEFYREDVSGQISSQMAMGIKAPPPRQQPLKSRFTIGNASQSIPEPIAVIGMSGRFPNAGNVRELWSNLKAGRNSITEIPADRWDWREYFGDPHRETGKTNSKWGGFLSDIDRFDPLFFEISPLEAELMDPRQRLFLEEAWHCFEDAGYMGARIKGMPCGVYVGVEEGEYGYLSAGKNLQINSNQNATLPARIAYKLDLKGPNFALTAACSSGLVAIHQACQAIRQGECELALAGGINVTISPWTYIGFSQMDMLSPDGQCHIFDQRANGMVPGEAVAVVLLKPLSKAITDKDHIYGCIKASGVNYDGKTNGINAPSPLSQADLIKNIYDKYRINPEDIQYVMGHSLGLQLGDPIEVQALINAFSKYTEQKQYCTLGSIKPLIGHTFAASGVVGLISMLMAIKDQTIPATHGYEFSNEYIDFKESPFVISGENQIWRTKNNRPRMGTISTTGNSGTNAHAVIEEYLPDTIADSLPVIINENNPVLFVLSANCKEQLKNYAESMKNFIESDKDYNLADLTYTLQTGREALDYRLAFMTASREALIQTLEGFLNNNPVGVLTDQVNKDKEGVRVFEADEDAKALLQTWIQKRKIKEIAEMWVKGLNFDWNKLYGENKPYRIGLPAYPFARERYWMSENDTKAARRTSLAIAARIHPLLHQNTSDFSEQRFSSSFTGDEFFLTDHLVNGQQVLPGVAYLEMVRAAIEQSTASEEERTGVRLKNVVWIRPFVMGRESRLIHIGLLPKDDGEITYKVYSESVAAGAEPLVHSQGSVMLNSLAKPATLDLKVLQDQCSQNCFMANELYEIFKAIGSDYGPGHRGIEVVYKGENQALAKLSLPDSVSTTLEQFVLHPSLMDSALQATIALGIGDSETRNETTQKLSLPFALQELEIFGRCTSSMWALVRYSNSSKAGDKQQKCDIDLSDAQGNVCVRFKGFSLRVLEGAVDTVSNSATPGILMFEPDRKEQDITTRARADATSSKMENKTIVDIGEDLLQEKALNYFKKLFSSVIKLPLNRIEADASLEKYGIDSVIAIQLTDQLEEVFGSLPKTLLFEYQDLQSLTGYFLESYRAKLIATLRIEEKAVKTENPGDSAAIIDSGKPAIIAHKHSRFKPIHFKSESPKEESTGIMDIAIIGIAGRYPGAANIREFWNNLRDGRDSITEIPKERWDHSLFFDEDKKKPGRTYCKWGGFLEGVDQFDPLFFNISPREAAAMDPMERLFLETVWSLFEDTGYTRETLQQLYQARVGVYVGAMNQEYGALIKETVSTLASYSFISNRISRYFNLQGPSIAVDTMCSSSAIAIHLACESLIRGDCGLAVAGGVNLTINPQKYLALSLSQMIGSHPDSRSFGDSDGMLPAEGVGAVLLKPLFKAIRDRDDILAVIKSTATNHAGQTNGMTPNPNAQAQLVIDNLTKSGIDPRTISYVEAAANGSALGDPIELTALTKAFRKYTPDEQFCAIGSVKSNIGHAEAVSGISQLTKVILQLQHGQLVPSIKAETLNPNIHFENTPFYLQRELAEWIRPVVRINGEEREFPRRATVSSFGAGGSNAHLIIEEYIPVQEGTINIRPIAEPQIMVFSAKNRERLQVVVKQILEFLEIQKDISLADLAYTLQVGREAMESRLAMVVTTQEELFQGLKEYLKSIQEGKMAEIFLPIFTGDMEEENSEVKSLLSGRVGETVFQLLMAEYNLEKLANHWTKGGKVLWETLHQGQEVRRILLPTYPFEKRRCWIESQLKPLFIAVPDNLPDNNITAAPIALKDRVIAIVSGLLGMTSAEVNLNKPLDQYGMDSIIMMQLLQQLQTQVDPLINIVRLQECRTIQDIINTVQPETKDKPVLLEQQTMIAVTSEKSNSVIQLQFPELIHLNQIVQGRPVFWIHPGLGSVAIYQPIAQRSGRPFYGIQARGFITDHPPIQGICAMAAYYIEIIQAVQPEGPYDLGGLSIGGVLSYEVTRQLQELGQVVNTIVMLDSQYGDEVRKKARISQITPLFEQVNIILGMGGHQLLHRDEVDTNLEEEAFLNHVIALARARGVISTEDLLRTRIQQRAKVFLVYELDQYNVLPLRDSHAVSCYYFRNKKGAFWGETEPYYLLATDEIPFENINYWAEWEKQLPNLRMIDLDYSCHMKILSEPKTDEVVMAFCEKLYSEGGMDAEFLESHLKSQENWESPPIKKKTTRRKRND